MKRINIKKASCVFYFCFLSFMFSIDFINGADFDSADLSKDDFLSQEKIGNTNEYLNNDIEKLIDNSKKKEIRLITDDKIKEHEKKVKFNLDSFLKKYKINLNQKNYLDSDVNNKRNSEFDIAKDKKETNTHKNYNSNDTNKNQNNVINKIFIVEDNSFKNLSDDKDDKNLSEKVVDEENSLNLKEEKDELGLQQALDFDYKNEMLEIENENFNFSLSKNTTDPFFIKSTIPFKSIPQKRNFTTTKNTEYIKSIKINIKKVANNKTEIPNKNNNINNDDNNKLKLLNEAKQKEKLLNSDIIKANEFTTANKNEAKEKNLNFLSKHESVLTNLFKTETEAKSSLLLSTKHTSELLFEKNLDAKLTLKLLQGSKQLKYFENLKAKINFSQNNFELTLITNLAETELNVKSYISNFAKIADEENEENLAKFYFDYGLMENCENFIFNKKNLSNYKAKDLNSFNNMFLNNEDHEDNIDSQDNPNYDEKAFDNEFLSLHNFNFYFNLEFNFAKIENNNYRINSVPDDMLLDSDNANANDNIYKKDESFLEIKNKQQENNYNKNNNNENQTSKETLNILVKLNFNHKNTNGKIFLDFFQSLNKNEKSVKWLYGRTKKDLVHKNKNSKKESQISSSSFIEKESEAAKTQFSLVEITNNYLNKLLNFNNENTNLKTNNFAFKKKQVILDDPLDKIEYYIKNLDKNYAEATIKEKKLLFLKFLNSVIYDSCKETRTMALKQKENLRSALKESFALTKKIENLLKKQKNLQAKKVSFSSLYADSAQMQSEKASIKSLELQQIEYYRNILSKIDKAFIRDALLMRKDEAKLSKKIYQLEAEKSFFNKTEKNLFEKRSGKESLEFELAADKKRIIQLQSEALDSESILGLIENDRLMIQNKLSFRSSRINKGKRAVALISKKIEKLKSEKNGTEFSIGNNNAKKRKINESIENDKELISEIEKKIEDLLAQKNKILENVNLQNENIEKIENENLISGNKLVLLTSNLNYLQSSLAQKQKNLDNSNKFLTQTQSELKKISDKKKIFATHINSLKASIANLTLAAQALQSQSDSVNKELSEIEVVKALCNKRILKFLDEINSIQINLSKTNANVKANKINKQNYQINIKNTIDNLVKEKVLQEDLKFYEYLENLEKESFKKRNKLYRENISLNNEFDFSNNEGVDDNEDHGSEGILDYYRYKKLKGKSFKEFFRSENNRIKGESKLPDIIKVFKADEEKDKILKSSLKSLNKTLGSDNKEEDDLYSELEIEGINKKEKIDLKLIDDYIVFDYDKLFRSINSNTIFNRVNDDSNLKERETNSDSESLLQEKDIKNNSNDKTLTTDYSENIESLNAEINTNKSEIEKSKKNLKEIKEQFYNIIRKIKDESYSSLKILIDLIQLEYKQNNLTNDHFNKINKLIDILK